ncbi:MAG: ribonuclease R [Mycoplasmoidaceae bacterium]|nr:ribonuclease R [Mycoplasmoidaceae bacterium]
MQNKKPDYYKQILEIVAKEGKRPIPIGIILRKLSNKEPGVDKNVFFKNIQSLINSAQLVKLRNGKLVLGYPKADVDMTNIYKGVIRINSKLAGFITEEGKEESGYFVHKTNLGGALDGDTVEFALLKIESPNKDLKDAKVLKVLKHAKGFYVGCFKSDGEHYQVETDDKKMYLPIKLEDTSGLTNGTKFLYTVVKFTETEAICKVAKIIGHINDVGTDILSIVYDNGIEPEFPEEVIDYANKLKLDINEEEKALRKDLTNLDIVTIDPATSKDFDDAVYCEQLEDGTYKLYVSIADVSHYVKMNSCLDLEALKRGCSTYLVDRVIPMLPHNLSDDLCSLNPNVPRLALTCEMIIDKKGSFLDIKTYPSIIKSHRRFSYDEVNAFFEGKDKLEKDTPEIRKMLQTSRKLHDILYTMKKNRGYVELEIPEVKIIVNEKCEPIEIKLRETGTAQSMIEDFMVAANEAVTIEAIKVK